jgi:hypothetical protein
MKERVGKHSNLMCVGIMAIVLLALLASGLCAQTTPNTISTGKKVALADHLMPEAPTVFVFIRASSTLEKAFLTDIAAEVKPSMGFNVIQLKTGQEPVAQQYQVNETPTAIVYDRRGRIVTRSANAEEIRAAIHKAAGVMRIDWAEEDDANYKESVRVLGRSPGTGILRTMTLQPEYLKYINDLSQKAHFTDGFLKRRTKEMIATYVSSLNHCKY